MKSNNDLRSSRASRVGCFPSLKRDVIHVSVLCNVAASFLQYSSASGRPCLFQQGNLQKTPSGMEMIQRLTTRTFTLQVPERLSAVSQGSADNLNPNKVSEY